MIDEPVQDCEHLIVITEDMFPSLETLDDPELARAPQHSVPTFPTMNFHESVYFDELMDQPMRSCEHRMTLALKIYLSQFIQLLL